MKIKEKVRNYSAITEQGTPLILAFKTESLTGVDYEDIHKILFGESIHDECKYFHEGLITSYSNLDGLYYSSASALFGFIWIAGDFTAPQASFIQNPRAALKQAFDMNWQSRLLQDP